MTKKKRNIVIISIAATLVIALGVTAAILISNYASDTFDRTLDRLFFDTARIEKLQESWEEDGFEESFDLYLPKIVTSWSKTLVLSKTSLNFGEDSLKRSTSFKIELGDRTLDLSAICDGSTVAISGIADECVTFPVENVREELENSLFAPSSDSMYALNEVTFEELVKTVESLLGMPKTKEELRREREIEKAFDRAFKKAEKELANDSSIAFFKDGEFFTNTKKYTVSKKTIIAYLNAIIEEAETCEALKEYISGFSYTALSYDSDIDDIFQGGAITISSNDQNQTPKYQTVYGAEAIEAFIKDFDDIYSTLDIEFCCTSNGKYITAFSLCIVQQLKEGDSTTYGIDGKLSYDKNVANATFTFTQPSLPETVIEYRKEDRKDGFDSFATLKYTDKNENGEDIEKNASIHLNYCDNGAFSLNIEDPDRTNVILFEGAILIDTKYATFDLWVDKVFKNKDELRTKTDWLNISVKPREQDTLTLPSGRSILKMEDIEFSRFVREIPIYTAESMLYDITGITFGFAYTYDEMWVWNPAGVLESFSDEWEAYCEYKKDNYIDQESIYFYDEFYDLYLVIDRYSRGKIYAVPPRNAFGHHSARIDKNGDFVLHEYFFKYKTESTCTQMGEEAYQCRYCNKLEIIREEMLDHKYTSTVFSTKYDDTDEEITVTLSWCENCTEEYYVECKYFYATFKKSSYNNAYTLSSYIPLENSYSTWLPEELSNYFTILH